MPELIEYPDDHVIQLGDLYWYIDLLPDYYLVFDVYCYGKTVAQMRTQIDIAWADLYRVGYLKTTTPKGNVCIVN